MRTDISQLDEQTYDLVVIGGGIFGVSIAWDAILRGLSVALIEKGDFGHATSANHFKMVHGGIRYLQHMDLARMRESSRERSILLRVAPHLVHPLPFVFPTYGHGMKGKEVMRAGLTLYDTLTVDRNRHIQDPSRRVPSGSLLSRREVLEMFPALPEQNLTGAAVFHECQMYNPARLTLAFLRSAIEAGADAFNYTEVVNFMKAGTHVNGVVVRDAITGAENRIRGSLVVNAAGPWAGELTERALGAPLQPQPYFSRDALFVVNRTLVSDRFALALPARSKDADALLSRGARHLFLIPWRGHTLVGVWHVVHHGGPDDYELTEADLREFIDEINEAYPGLGLTLDDVSMANAGLILFGDASDGQDPNEHSFGKRSLVVDHGARGEADGLVTVIGVRYTIARAVAERVVDLALEKSGRPLQRSKTDETVVYGGDVDQIEATIESVARRYRSVIEPAVARSLVHNYGSAYADVLAYLDENPAWTARLGETNVIEAEAVHAVRQEMAVKLSDVVFRRTELASGGDPGQAALERCAVIMAAELDWDERRIDAELQEVAAELPSRTLQQNETERMSEPQAAPAFAAD